MLVRLSLVVVIDANWVLQWEIMVNLSLALVSHVFGSCGVIAVNLIFGYGFILGSGPLWSPYWVILVVMSGSPFTPIQAQV